MAVLDSSFLIDLERRTPEAMEALDRLVTEEESLLVAPQAAIEYLSGIEDRATALRVLEESFVMVALERDHVLEAARLARDAFGAGSFPGWADAQIVAAAVLEATFVVTADPKRFRALGVPVWDYRREAKPPASPLTP